MYPFQLSHTHTITDELILKLTFGIAIILFIEVNNNIKKYNLKNGGCCLTS